MNIGGKFIRVQTDLRQFLNGRYFFWRGWPFRLSRLRTGCYPVTTPQVCSRIQEYGAPEKTLGKLWLRAFTILGGARRPI